MDNREALKNMLNNLINDKHEEASMDLHGYLSAKMKDVAGLSAQAPAVQQDDADIDSDEE
jgi:hypothetical protein